LGFLLIIFRGACISYCDDLQRIAKNIEEYHPSVVIAVPLLLEHMLKRSEKAVRENLPGKYKAKASNLSLYEILHSVPFYIRLAIKMKLKKAFGGKLHLFIVGAAGIDKSIIETFCSLGIRTLQGYGLTECSPLLAGNNDFYLKSDSTGLPIHGVEIRIDEPNSEGIGEIIAKGDNIMLGYYKDEEATRHVMRGGYFHTGDLGYLDSEGFLYIAGRLKNVIITKNGKNIYPEELEHRLNENELVAESIVVGSEGRGGDVCVTAKILPDLEWLKNKLQGRIPSIDDIRTEIKAIVDMINDKLPAYKRIRSFVIMNEGFEKTTTNKIKRYGKNIASAN
jgi:long-chain acyl-CoA synthetase